MSTDDTRAVCTCGAIESGDMAQHLTPCPIAVDDLITQALKQLDESALSEDAQEMLRLVRVNADLSRENERLRFALTERHLNGLPEVYGTDAARAGEVAAEEVEAATRAIVRDEFRQIGHLNVTDDEIDRGLAQGLVEGDDMRANAAAALAAVLPAHDAEWQARLDGLAAENERLREVVALTQRDRDARRRQGDEARAERDRWHEAALAASAGESQVEAERDRLAAGVRELADEWDDADGNGLDTALQSIRLEVAVNRLRALLGPADDGGVAPESTDRLLEAPDGAVRPDIGGSAGSVGGL